MIDIEKVILRAKPKYKASSVNQFKSTFNSINKAVNGGKLDNLDWLQDTQRVEKYINDALKTKDIKTATARNYYNALSTIALDNPKRDTSPTYLFYQDKMDIYTKLKNEAECSHEKSSNQEENWISKKEIYEVLDAVKKRVADGGIFKLPKDSLTPGQNRIYQDYVLLSIYTEVPSRNDFATAKIISKHDYNLSHSTDENYLVLERDNIHFAIHNWKTKGSYKDADDFRIIPLSPELQTIIRLFLKKFSDREYLFYSRTAPLNRNNLSKHLAYMFKTHTGKKIASNMLRHILLSDEVGCDVAMELEQKASNYGHSIGTQLKYVKK